MSVLELACLYYYFFAGTLAAIEVFRALQKQ